MPLDIFDEIELSPEDKILISEEFKKFLSGEIKKEISKIPLEKIITRLASIEKQIAPIDKNNSVKIEAARKEASNFYQTLKSEISDIKKDLIADSNADSEMEISMKAHIEKSIQTMKKEYEEILDKLRKKYDDLKTEILNQPRYEFGGFSPQFNDLNIGDPATEGSWRIVKSGSNLSFQRYESGSWVEKGAMTS